MSSGTGNSASSFPMSSPHQPREECGVCSSSCSDQDSWHIFLCAVCSQAASSFRASDLALHMIYTGTDQSKHSPCQSCSSDSVAEPQGKYFQSRRLCYKSPEALEGLWSLSFSLPSFLRVPHSSCPPTCAAAGDSYGTHGSAPCWCLCLQRGAGRGAGSPWQDCCWMGTAHHIHGAADGWGQGKV